MMDILAWAIVGITDILTFLSRKLDSNKTHLSLAKIWFDVFMPDPEYVL